MKENTTKAIKPADENEGSSFDLQPFLENDLLLLRPLKEEDFEDLFRVASDPDIWEQHPAKDRSQRNGFRHFFADAMSSKGAFAVIDKKKGEIIGSTRFHRVKETGKAIEIGWTFLARHYWGGVYNRSMKELMIVYAFQFVENILFYINEKNIRSQKAIEKLGGKQIFTLEGYNLEVKPASSVIYLINKKNWESKK
jgi:RimJ/RimL family protein N-acetyltransferase